MRRLQLPVILLLGLCLQLMAQSPFQPSKPFTVALILPEEEETVRAGEDFVVTTRVTSSFTECMVIRTSVLTNPDLTFPYGNFSYTACLCPGDQRNFFWDIIANRTTTITAMAEAIEEEGICTEDLAIRPPSDRVDSQTKTLNVKA
ncbi:prolactin-inducible protein homolog [Tachyglossus aculeatus]|uniref:prolactin-inducible protein homolog n=1 Tax=Tachyglossus aculeatus TaxID=9261 RepID=UPI0018F68A4B|nr:prolactin-inducible protein homolog [Tachyglossus aculeatus]